MQSLSSDFSKGQLIESFVISEIEKRRKLGYFDCDELYYYESSAGREVDLILEEKNQILVIEIKSTHTVSGINLRSLREFDIKTNKKLRRIIFYMGSDFYIEKYNNQPNIEVVPIYSLFRLGRI